MPPFPGIDGDELTRRFGYHAPRDDDIKGRHERVREACRAAAVILVHESPTCPEQTLAVRALEEAMMWANAAIARNQ